MAYTDEYGFSYGDEFIPNDIGLSPEDLLYSIGDSYWQDPSIFSDYMLPDGSFDFDAIQSELDNGYYPDSKPLPADEFSIDPNTGALSWGTYGNISPEDVQYMLDEGLITGEDLGNLIEAGYQLPEDTTTTPITHINQNNYDLSRMTRGALDAALKAGGITKAQYNQHFPSATDTRGSGVNTGGAAPDSLPGTSTSQITPTGQPAPGSPGATESVTGILDSLKGLIPNNAIDWAGLAGAAASIYGGVAGKDAAQRARDYQVQSINEAQRLAAENQNKQLNAITGGYQGARDTLANSYKTGISTLGDYYGRANDAITSGYNAGGQAVRDAYGQSVAATNTGYDQGLSALERGYNQGRSDLTGALDTVKSQYQPWMDSERANLDRLTAATSAGGRLDPALRYSMDMYEQSPEYKAMMSALGRSNQGLEARGAATGNFVNSGAMQNALLKNAQDYSLQGYQTGLNNWAGAQQRDLSTLAALATPTMTTGYGDRAYNTGTQLSNLAQNYGTNVANAQVGRGTALSNIATGQGTALSNLATGQGTTIGNLLGQQGANLANLYGQQGQSLSNLIGSQANAEAGIYGDMSNTAANNALSVGKANAAAELAGTNAYTGMVNNLLSTLGSWSGANQWQDLVKQYLSRPSRVGGAVG